jgi:dienelactone hydrolase
MKRFCANFSKFYSVQKTISQRLRFLQMLFTAAVLWTFITPPSHAKLIAETFKVPVVVTDAWGKEVARDIVVSTFFEDTTPKPRPIMVINHGRAPDPADRAALGRATYLTNASWFAKLGFLVAVPTRVGYGVTGGDDVENSGLCGQKNYPPGYGAAAAQTLKVLELVRLRPDAAKDRAVIVGQSFGGATSIAVAAQNPVGVQAAINFAGGGGGNPITMPQNPCGPRLLERLFAGYGKTARVPTLWIYTENDMFMGPTLPKEWFEAFKAAGGIGQYQLYPPLGKNGHGLFSMAPDIWRPRVLTFLRANGYPDLMAPASEIKAPALEAAPMKVDD